MWCMLYSPLLAGNDLSQMSKENIEILTNKEVIGLNKDQAFKQATRVLTENNVEVWLKPLLDKSGKSVAIAIMNRGDEQVQYELNLDKLNIDPKSKLRDLWLHKVLGEAGQTRKFMLPKHGVVVLTCHVKD